ncbi:hypothetical protein FRA_24c01370 [Francisella sp. W12-1067]|nr:hypothetical protein FRA_24c01370 [Francisella sp. W12-1067]
MNKRVLIINYDKYGHPELWYPALAKDYHITVMNFDEYTMEVSFKFPGLSDKLTEFKISSLWGNFLKHIETCVQHGRTFRFSYNWKQVTKLKKMDAITCILNLHDVLIIEPTSRNLRLGFVPNPALTNKNIPEVKYTKKNTQFNDLDSLKEDMVEFIFPKFLDHFIKKGKPIFGTCFGHQMMSMLEGLPVRKLVTTKDMEDNVWHTERQKPHYMTDNKSMTKLLGNDKKYQYLGESFDYEHHLVAYLPLNKEHNIANQLRKNSLLTDVRGDKELPWISIDGHEVLVKPHHMYTMTTTERQIMLGKRFDYWEKNLAIGELWTPRCHTWQHHIHMEGRSPENIIFLLKGDYKKPIKPSLSFKCDLKPQVSYDLQNQNIPYFFIKTLCSL